MIVCICKAISYSTLEKSLKETNASNPLEMLELLKSRFKVGITCGSCLGSLETLCKKHLDSKE